MTERSRCWTRVLFMTTLFAVLSLTPATAPAQLLARRNQSKQLKKVRVNGVELHYVERGRGTAVVFVHGGVEDYRTWQSQMEPFSKRYHVIAYSRRYNYPNHNPAISYDHSAIVEADDLAALIRSLKLRPAHIVGSSYGAYTALFLALRHPKLVRTLVLAEAPALRLVRVNSEGAAAYEEFMTNLWNPVGEAFRAGDKERALRLTAEYFGGKGAFEQVPEEMRQGWRVNLVEWEALTTSSDAFPELRREDIRKIKVPVLVLSGEQTLPIHKLVDLELQPLLRSVKRVIIPKASHDMWSEGPEACRRAALAFLDRH
ncbi:MAG: alpha/beta fold hydrolase [Pyrinomonadaceae bacterium]